MNHCLHRSSPFYLGAGALLPKTNSQASQLGAPDDSGERLRLRWRSLFCTERRHYASPQNPDQKTAAWWENAELNRGPVVVQSPDAPASPVWREGSRLLFYAGSDRRFWFLISGRSLAKKLSPCISKYRIFRSACRCFSSCTRSVWRRFLRVVSLPE